MAVKAPITKEGVFEKQLTPKARKRRFTRAGAMGEGGATGSQIATIKDALLAERRQTRALLGFNRLKNARRQIEQINDTRWSCDYNINTDDFPSNPTKHAVRFSVEELKGDKGFYDAANNKFKYVCGMSGDYKIDINLFVKIESSSETAELNAETYIYNCLAAYQDAITLYLYKNGSALFETVGAFPQTIYDSGDKWTTPVHYNYNWIYYFSASGLARLQAGDEITTKIDLFNYLTAYAIPLTIKGDISIHAINNYNGGLR